MTQSEQDDTNVDAVANGPPQTMRTRLGIALVVFSGVLWFSLFAIPFFPLQTGQKAAAAGTVFVGVQITWWGGAALAGPRVMTSLTKWFRGLRNRPTEE